MNKQKVKPDMNAIGFQNKRLTDIDFNKQSNMIRLNNNSFQGLSHKKKAQPLVYSHFYKQIWSRISDKSSSLTSSFDMGFRNQATLPSTGSKLFKNAKKTIKTINYDKLTLRKQRRAQNRSIQDDFIRQSMGLFWLI